MRVSAPGFQTVAQGVTVAGSNPPCRCPTVQTQQLSMVLTPS
jgi:hypothetical protein